MQLKSVNTFAITIMFGFALIILFFSGFLDFPLTASSIPSTKNQILTTISASKPDPFSNLFGAFKKWDSQVGCAQFRDKHKGLLLNSSSSGSLQKVDEALTHTHEPVRNFDPIILVCLLV